MKTLKQKDIDEGSYRNLSQARSVIGAIIETVYNCQRLHSALDYGSPDEYEAILRGIPVQCSFRPAGRPGGASLLARRPAALPVAM